LAIKNVYVLAISMNVLHNNSYGLNKIIFKSVSN